MRRPRGNIGQPQQQQQQVWRMWGASDDMLWKGSKAQVVVERLLKRHVLVSFRVEPAVPVEANVLRICLSSKTITISNRPIASSKSFDRSFLNLRWAKS